MSARHPSTAAARDVLADPERSSNGPAGRTQPEVRLDASRDASGATSARSRAKGGQDAVVVSVETDEWFTRYWTVPDMPNAVRAAGAFARDPDAVDQSDIDAIEAYLQHHGSRVSLRILAASGQEFALITAAHTNPPSTEPRDLPNRVELRPLDLFSKFGFDDGEVLDGHVQMLRIEGWCMGADELLRAVVEAKVLPLLDPRPTLDRILSLHNNVRGLLLGYEEELEEEDYGFVPPATAGWPASITVSTAEILELGREVAGPLTRRVRALEEALED
jgi:hypothetical protein